MFTVTTTGLDEWVRDLGALREKTPSILARTLTETAKDAERQVIGWLPRLIDRPTPYTMRSTAVFAALKSDLRAAVAFKKEYGRVGRHAMDSTDASRSMRAQVYGGRRLLKHAEKSLLDNYITKSYAPFLIPAKGAKRDRYGNVPGSFMNKVLYQGVRRGSASQAYHVPLNNRKMADSSRGQYFVMRKGFGKVPVGIYKNVGKRKPPLPVFLFSRKAEYKKRIPFYQIVQAEFDRKVKQRFNESVDVVAAKYLR